MEILAGYGERLRRGRKKAGMSVKDVAKATGKIRNRPVDHGSISKYENEHQEPGMEILCAICYVTRTNPGWVMTDLGDPYWDLGSDDGADDHRRFAAQLRHLADQLERAAEAGVDMLEAEVASVEVFEDPRKGKDRGLGTPREEAS